MFCLIAGCNIKHNAEVEKHTNECQEWCVCEEECKSSRLCLCSNPDLERGCCKRGWDDVPSVTVELK